MDHNIDIQGFLNGSRSYGAVGMHNLLRSLSDVPRRTDPLVAYHVLSTEPYFIWNEGRAFQMREYEQLTAELSACLWRCNNGPIYLLTDWQGAAAHTEPVWEPLYPPFSSYLMSPRYSFPRQWDPLVEPMNTFFVYFADDGFKNDYARQAVRFMQFERDTLENGSMCMVFAEQRILGMCAAADIQVKTFLEYGKPLDGQKLMTHIWSAKRLLHWNSEAENGYNALCRKTLIQLMEMSRLHV